MSLPIGGVIWKSDFAWFPVYDFAGYTCAERCDESEPVISEGPSLTRSQLAYTSSMEISVGDFYFMPTYSLRVIVGLESGDTLFGYSREFTDGESFTVKNRFYLPVVFRAADGLSLSLLGLASFPLQEYVVAGQIAWDTGFDGVSVKAVVSYGGYEVSDITDPLIGGFNTALQIAYSY